MKPKLCVIGLGNPGTKYKNTRHNLGFEWIDEVVGSSLFTGQKLEFSEKYDSLWCVGRLHDFEVHFLKPLTFMNLSGKAYAKWKLKNQSEHELLVVLDDMDIDLGRIRLRADGSDGGHRGLRSVIEAFGSNKVPRLKLGIGRSADETIDHVLSKFNPQEKLVVNKCLQDAPSVFENFVNYSLNGDFEKALCFINGRNYSDGPNGEIKNGG